MRIIVCEDYDDMSRRAAKVLISQLALKPDSILGLATGSTPIGLYDNLVDAYNNGEVDFSNVTTFNLDEYYPINAENSQSYRYFMNKHLFSRVNIDLGRTSVPNGEAKDPEAECEEYEKRIEAAGGVDLQVLGIGQNGHIGFNEPDVALNLVTHLTELAEDTVEANARFFDSKEEVPTRALTMGIGTILKSKRIILLASGAKKHNAVKALMDKNITTDVPATLLKLHSDVLLICDKAAFFGDSEEKDKVIVGIDLGGTNIAAGIIGADGNVTAKASIPTRKGVGYKEIVKDMADLVKGLVKGAGLTEKDIRSVGIGCPGFINRERGEIIIASNLGFKNAPIADEFRKYIDVPVNIENDADAAALGEHSLSKEKCSNMVFVTLGTGVGSGVIIDGKIYRGRNGEGSELGHILFMQNGEKCTCGRNGCYERYASASALVRQTKKAIAENKDSMMAAEKEITGRTAFDYAKKGDAVAEGVVSRYVSYVAEGLMDVIMIFRPERIVIGGGISGEGEYLAKRIREYVSGHFDGDAFDKTEISIADLCSDAGIIGAALAAKDI